MTSKRSFTDTMREDLKRRIWPLALSFTGFFFALPVLALIKLGDHVTSLNEGWDNLVSLQQSFVTYAVGPSNAFAIAGLMIMAVLNAIQGMKYLHSRQEADFYGAIPVLRTTKFNATFLNGILIAVVPYMLMHMLAVIIGATRGFVTGAGFIFAIQTMLLEIAGFLLIYTVIVLAAVLTGHTAVAVAGGAVLSFVLLAYALLIEGYKSTFFVTLYSENYDSMLYLSPITLFFTMLDTTDASRGRIYYEVTHTDYHMRNLIIAAACVVASVILFIIITKLIKIRPAEAAGKAMAFEKTKPFIKVIIMIPVAMTFGVFFPSMADNGATYAWLAFGIIVGLILAHAVIEIIYEFDFKACLKHIPSGIVAAVITSAIVCFFVFDFTGYDTKLPDRGRIENAAVYLSGIENGMYGRGYTMYGDYSYSMSDSDICMENMVLTDVDDVYAIAQAGCEHAAKFRWHRRAAGEDTEYYDGPEYTDISVTLRSASGSEFKRTYYVDTEDPAILEAMRKIYDTKEYKDNTYEILAESDKMREGTVDIIRFETSGHTETADGVTDSDTDRLIDTMKKETEALTLDTLREEAPIGYLEYELKPDPQMSTSIPVGYVYPSFTETIALLKDMGMNIRDGSDPDSVDYIMELTYDDEGNEYPERIDDRAAINDLLPEIVNQDYSSVNYAVFRVDYEKTYEVHYKGTLQDEYNGITTEYCLKKK